MTASSAMIEGVQDEGDRDYERESEERKSKEREKRDWLVVDRRPDTMDCHGVEGVGRKHVHSSFVPLSYHI